MNAPLETMTPDGEPKSGARTGPGIVGLIWGFVAAVFLFIGLGYLMVQGEQWYGQSLTATPSLSWYAWPWGWPGPNVVEGVYSWMGMEPWDHQIDHTMRMFGALPRFALAVVVNTFIEMMPLVAFAAVVGAARNARARAATDPK